MERTSRLARLRATALLGRRCLLLALAIGFAACGGGTCGGTSSQSQTSSPPGEHQANAPSCTASTASATPPPAGAFVGLGTVSIGGKTCIILTDSTGRTLYYDKNDSATKLACTSDNGCTNTWRPLHLVSGPLKAPWLPGKLTVWSNSPNGSVVLYNGHPLYRYIPEFDTRTGTANGQGKDGVWFIAIPDLPAQT